MPFLEMLPEIPFRFVVQAQTDDDGRLCCPVCACPDVHPEQVIVQHPDQCTVVTSRRTDVRPVPLRCQRSQIALRFWCEQGHDFQYELTFRAGHVALGLTANRRPGPLSPTEPWSG